MTVNGQYGNYIEVECCSECDWAASDADEFFFAPMPNICPECGGKTGYSIGRWVYSVVPEPWYTRYLIGFGPETIYHGFERGRERDINHKKIVDNIPCDCDGYKISDSGNGYQPCHNRKEPRPHNNF